MDEELAKTVMWYGLAFLCIALGAGSAYMFWRLGRLLRRAERSTHSLVDETLPLMQKVGTSLDGVNSQLGKVDIMMDSAVDMTEALDTSVRAVSMAITEPVKKATAAVAGVNEAVTSLYERVSEDFAGGADSRRGAAAGGEQVHG